MSSETDDVEPLELHGVVPPMLTGFDAAGEVDLDRTAAHARYVVDGGVHGVFPLGTNGEFALLSGSERDAVVAAVVEEVAGEVPVIAGVGTPGTARTVERARAAEAAGADGVVAVTPYYYPMDQAALLRHYERLDESIGLPIYIYQIPSRTGVTLSHATLADLAELDGVVGLKDSSKDIGWLVQAQLECPELHFLIGSDSLLKPGLDAGCVGLVSAVANVFPELVVSLYEDHQHGRTEALRRRQERVLQVRAALKQGPYLAGIKEALSLSGLELGPLRAPLSRMSEPETETLRETLREQDLL